MNTADKTRAVELSEILGRTVQPKRRMLGWLVAMNGPEAGVDYRLWAEGTRVGTAADSDIVLSDGHVSARHCIIRWYQGRVVIRDLDSSNGTWLNGRKVHEEVMISKDELQLGRTILRCKLMF